MLLLNSWLINASTPQHTHVSHHSRQWVWQTAVESLLQAFVSRPLTDSDIVEPPKFCGDVDLVQIHYGPLWRYALQLRGQYFADIPVHAYYTVELQYSAEV